MEVGQKYNLSEIVNNHKKERKSGIYKITNIKTNKIYVGSAKDIDFRWKRHIYELQNHIHSNKHLQNSWLKHSSLNFKFEVLEFCDNDVLYVREQFWLDNLEPFYYNNGYNISQLAQGGGGELSEEGRNKIIKMSLGNKKGRRVNRWPCTDGWKCKCEKCVNQRKFEQSIRNAKR